MCKNQTENFQIVNNHHYLHTPYNKTFCNVKSGPIVQSIWYEGFEVNCCFNETINK